MINVVFGIGWSINIRRHAITYSKEKAKQRREKEKMIQQKYNEGTRLFENDPNNLSISRLIEIKEKLELFMQRKYGIIILAKALWHES